MICEENVYRKRPFDYLSLAGGVTGCKSKSSFKQSCIKIAETLGYDYYFLSSYFPIVDRVVISSNYPKEWLDRYDSLGYSTTDPAMKHCWADPNPIDWRDIVYSTGTVGASEKKVMMEAKSFGLYTGISIPIHGVGAESGMLSLSSNQITSNIVKLDSLGLYVIAQSMKLSMKDIYNIPVNNLASNLSSREDQCMAWTAKGKTSWEIAKILDISESTVIFHMRNSIKKLEATNRTQAVAKAISLHRIRPYM